MNRLCLCPIHCRLYQIQYTFQSLEQTTLDTGEANAGQSTYKIRVALPGMRPGNPLLGAEESAHHAQ